MVQKFSKKEATKFGWQLAKKNIKFFFLILIFVWGISIGLGVFSDLAKTFLFSFFLTIIQFAVSIIFDLGLIKISLNFYDKIEPKFSQLFSQYPLFFRYLFASILYSLIVFFGLIFLLIPGIIFAIRFSFFGYLIVDKNSGAIESLKKSWQMTRGNTLNLFFFYLLLPLINLLGLLVFLVGLFWALPTTLLATAFVYRQLVKVEE